MPLPDRRLMLTFMSRSLKRILCDLHGSVQRRVWSNDFVVPHDGKTEVLSATVVHEFVFLLRPILSYHLRVFQPRIRINDCLGEGLDPWKRIINIRVLNVNTRDWCLPERVLAIGPRTDEIDSCPSNALTAP